MWMDDPDLIAVLHQMANVCVVVTKQTRVKFDQPGTQPLVELAAERGLGQSAYPELDDLAARDASGDALMVGPYTPDWRQTMSIGGVREVGYRKSGNRLVPIVHSKIMLLGQMWWSDEHPSGHTVDQIGFRPEWLWLGSPNFTKASRRSLETGMWIKDPSMLLAARKFLLGLVAMSEPLGAGPDLPEPQLVPVSYDDQAMSEYFAEHRYDYFEEEV